MNIIFIVNALNKCVHYNSLYSEKEVNALNKEKNKSSVRIAYYRLLLTVLNAALITLCVLTVTTQVFSRSDSLLKNKVLQMSAQLNMQMQINLDSYLERIETIGTLAFATPLNYTYDDTDPANDEYEAVKAREAITDNLYRICMMENFVDFGIIYSNNNFAGKISNGSLKTFGDDIYSDLRSKITRPATSDGWFTGYDNNYRRIYYVKKIHDNAILMLSFYSSELKNVFEHSKSEGMETLSVKLVGTDDTVIYSNLDDETGEKLSYDFLSRINSSVYSNFNMIDDKYLISVNVCSTEWKVICSMPSDVVLTEKSGLLRSVVVISALAMLLSIIVSAIISRKIMNPVNSLVLDLDDEAHTDLLTGILNKRSFEMFTENAIEDAEDSGTYSLILLDLDNFKGVNDTLGHEYGDKVLAGVGDILRSVFSDNDYLGRLGGDEFSVFLNTEGRDVLEYTEEKCRQLCEAFADNYTGDNHSYKISASIGASFYPEHGDCFSDLYRRADRALYLSKRRGKDRYSLFTMEMEEDGI